MTAKTTYTATSTYTGEAATRTSARDYGYALDVNVPAFPAYTVPAGTYWVTTGHQMHKYNRETGTRGYWNEFKEDQVHTGGTPTQGIYSFHGTKEAAEKAGRALQSQYRRRVEALARDYGVKVEAAPVTFTAVPTTV